MKASSRTASVAPKKSMTECSDKEWRTLEPPGVVVAKQVVAVPVDQANGAKVGDEGSSSVAACKRMRFVKNVRKRRKWKVVSTSGISVLKHVGAVPVGIVLVARDGRVVANHVSSAHLADTVDAVEAST